MLNEKEREFIKDTYAFYSDDRIVIELNRIRHAVGNGEAVTIDMVRKARYKLGIKTGPQGRAEGGSLGDT